MNTRAGIHAIAHGWQSWFIPSAGTLLAITGAAKLMSASTTSKIMHVQDPMFGLPFRDLMNGAGLVELCVGLICLLTKKPYLSFGLVAWLAINLFLYRIGLWIMDWKQPCSCLGSLTDALHISPRIADSLMKVVLAWLLIGSIIGLTITSVKRRQPI